MNLRIPLFYLFPGVRAELVLGRRRLFNGFGRAVIDSNLGQTRGQVDFLADGGDFLRPENERL